MTVYLSRDITTGVFMMPASLLFLIRSLSVVFGVLVGVLLLGAAVISVREGERRAARKLLVWGALLSLPYLAAGIATFPGQGIAAAGLILLPVVMGAALLLPTGHTPPGDDDMPTRRIDERDIMFSRWRLQPGSARFEGYYERNPDKRALDDKFRARPGLLCKGATFYNPYLFSAADASFEAVSAFHAIADHDPAPEQVPVDPAQMSQFIHWWGKKLGAVSVGITALQAYHLYSYLGRTETYGQPVEHDHRFAIALTVEMDRHMLDYAPFGPTAMESAQQYLNVGAIAIQMAEYIRCLGYPARAHFDGSYRVVCPLVARDAGLGEIGRMGLLMTPELGPRVRLAVVTTDLPLVTSPRRRDDSVLDFCARCKKCAEVCPSRAIPLGDRTEIDGVKRWQINSEACFTYWCTVGTDCGRCVRVCPYSHPDNILHNIIRSGVRRSPRFRIAAIKMDDWLYGKKPAPLALPEWMQTETLRQGATGQDPAAST
jgi:reductive dehalogenase